jgi:hypothetical protein
MGPVLSFDSYIVFAFTEKAKGAQWSTAFSNGAWSAEKDGEEVSNVEFQIQSEALEAGSSLSSMESLRIGFFPDAAVKLQPLAGADEDAKLDDNFDKKTVLPIPGIFSPCCWLEFSGLLIIVSS